MEVYTIGHSNHSWETFLPLLKENGIEVLVDVRSKPISRFAPFSNLHLGEVMEVGNHDELMERDGLYAHLYHMNYATIEAPIAVAGDD